MDKVPDRAKDAVNAEDTVLPGIGEAAEGCVGSGGAATSHYTSTIRHLDLVSMERLGERHRRRPTDLFPGNVAIRARQV